MLWNLEIILGWGLVKVEGEYLLLMVRMKCAVKVLDLQARLFRKKIELRRWKVKDSRKIRRGKWKKKKNNWNNK